MFHQKTDFYMVKIFNIELNLLPETWFRVLEMMTLEHLCVQA